LVRPKRLWHNWKRHWPDALAVVFVLLVSTGVLLRASAIGKPGVEYVAVKQGISLPVLHQVVAGDLEMKSVPGSKASFTTPEQVSGRYTLAVLSPGALLQSSQLLSPELSARMTGRKILSVALKPTAYSAALSPPSAAVMILSPRAPDAKNPAPILFDVIVLSIDTIGDSKSATVAFTPDEFLIAAPLLASHEVFLSQSMH